MVLLVACTGRVERIGCDDTEIVDVVGEDNCRSSHLKTVSGQDQ